LIQAQQSAVTEWQWNISWNRSTELSSSPLNVILTEILNSDSATTILKLEWAYPFQHCECNTMRLKTKYLIFS